MAKLYKKKLGQYWTPKHIVSDMMQLIKNNGFFLEPSAGNGAFLDELPIKKTVGIEIDNKFKKKNLLNLDFFKFKTKEKFDTIIGNPPYVKFKDIQIETKKELIKLNQEYDLDNRTNLYIFFIRKCLDHLKENGEIIFITPRDWLSNTSGRKLNKYLYSKGSITDYIDLSDKKSFFDADVDSIIWRFQKGNFIRKTNFMHNFLLTKDGQLILTKQDPHSYMNDFFEVKVGAASGAINLFKSPNGIPFVVSETRKNGNLINYIYNTKSKELEKHKDKLIKRKISSFNEKNWFMWGRKFYESARRRIYVNCKTRIANPFFYNSCKNYNGSVLAIFPKKNLTIYQIRKVIIFLNNVDWRDKGLMAGGRFVFSQNSLLNTFFSEKETLTLKKILQIS